MTRGISEERFLVRLSDSDVADMILAAADAAHPPTVGNGWNLYREGVVAMAVAMGRRLGKRVGIEPLDDAMRSAVDSELIDLVRHNAPGRHGWIHTLERLAGFLNRYPERGRPDDGGPGVHVPAPFPEVDVTVPPSLIQEIALSRNVLDGYGNGTGKLTAADALRVARLLERWWETAPLAPPNPAR